MKKMLGPESSFHALRASLSFSLLVVVTLCAFGVASTRAKQADHNQRPGTPELFQARTGEHIGQPDSAVSGMAGDLIGSQALANEIARSRAAVPAAVMAPTRSSFLANWKTVGGAVGYRLDVAVSNTFERYVAGYQDLDVGNVTSRIVSELSQGTTYYYRVRAYDARGTTRESDVMTATTITSPGLVITPTFDSSILTNPNSGTIQVMINQAIALYQSLYSDPLDVKILFRYSTTTPGGGSMGTSLARSTFVLYSIPWNSYKNALVADARTGNDAVANASLPSSSLSTNVAPSSAGGRAIGLNTPPAMFANGTVGTGGPYDGIVTLNFSQPFQFTRPPGAGNFDAQRSTEHEIDEVLGLGSFLNVTSSSDVRPQDLFSWSAPGTRNLTTAGSRYFSINGGNTNIIGFNQDPTGDFGDWLSDPCPQANPYPQNAFGCPGQFADVTATLPEGINLDVIGYDLGITAYTITTSSSPSNGGATSGGGTFAAGTSQTVTASPNGGFTFTNWTENGSVVSTSASYTFTLNSNRNLLANFSSGTPTPPPTFPVQFGNISTRLGVGTGDRALIGGFIVTGTQPKRVIVRAIGPSLVPFGVPGAISDPTLELRDSSGGVIAFNDDWHDSQAAEIIATGLPPTDNLESAIVTTLSGNNSAYTAVVRGFNNSTGIGVVEAYDLDRATNSKLANISTRGLVNSGDDVMIGGIIIVGNTTANVLIRAIGPSLINFGVPNPLPDPTLELYDGNGTLLAFNDDWRTDQQAAIIATGLAPTNDLESAIVGGLPPGPYTAVVRGYQNATGVGVVEGYQLP
jgi:hypothetical protein